MLHRLASSLVRLGFKAQAKHRVRVSRQYEQYGKGCIGRSYVLVLHPVDLTVQLAIDNGRIRHGRWRNGTKGRNRSGCRL